MTMIPKEFEEYTRRIFGEDRFAKFMDAFQQEAPVSIRVNPKKCKDNGEQGLQPIPWCETGYYLPQRPDFTFDPLLHAGCYYVQEASSMFIYHVLRQHIHQPVTMLDLCAAPGGKSTAALSALPEGSMLWANEPIRTRAQILNENIQKWGWENCIVTNLYPKDYAHAKMRFDVILCDVPCSGEGMFRKDEGAIAEWSPQNVEKCWRLQRDIVGEAWKCLKDGGLFIYSTCTFNTYENEENIRWMQEELGAEVIPVETEAQWNITGSLLEGFSEPVYRFIPGITRGEGLFVCVMRKGSPSQLHQGREEKGKKREVSGMEKADVAEALSTALNPGKYPMAELSYSTAISFLRREAIVLPPETPRGMVVVTYEGHPLGFVKNIGNRANNLYPKEWRIKSTHIPDTPPRIINCKQ
ncbi:MAG: hypothetical protein IJS97_05890 [Prevotella sp.]|nr:hypothetical protein [Prevotella sp.]